MTNGLMGGLLLLAAVPAFAQDNYDVNFMASQAEQIVGDVQLVSGTTGEIVPSDVLSYSFSSVLGDPLNFWVAGAGSSAVSCYQVCGLSVSGNGLFYTPVPLPANAYETGVYTSSGTNFANETGEYNSSRMSLDGTINLYNNYAGGGFALFTTDGLNPSSTYSLLDDLRLGTDPATAAPEIDASGALPALTLLSGILLTLRGRRRLVA